LVAGARHSALIQDIDLADEVSQAADLRPHDVKLAAFITDTIFSTDGMPAPCAGTRGLIDLFDRNTLAS
jgi:hypothetical protein